MSVEGFPKNVRMANLACIGSRKVNGVAEVCTFLSCIRFHKAKDLMIL